MQGVFLASANVVVVMALRVVLTVSTVTVTTIMIETKTVMDRRFRRTSRARPARTLLWAKGIFGLGRSARPLRTAVRLPGGYQLSASVFPFLGKAGRRHTS